MKNKGKKPLELYLHIPFCVKKCDYCDFLSGPSGTETRKAYTEALIREIQALPEHLDREVVSVFTGGGTPFSSGCFGHGTDHGGSPRQI